ncbi:hypothetical protein ACW4EZ_13700 [Bacillus toyonensis]|nr:MULTISPECIES: hypothetical protein [Bacillus cereus group]MBJ7930647.1 hypothetical protein [Bacillus cereus group sp. N31]HDX9610107.1 hypothetical protein [Bacillus toyonensis]
MMESITLSQYIEEQTRQSIAIANEVCKKSVDTMAYDEIEHELSKQYPRFAEDYEHHQ